MSPYKCFGNKIKIESWFIELRLHAVAHSLVFSIHSTQWIEINERVLLRAGTKGCLALTLWNTSRIDWMFVDKNYCVLHLWMLAVLQFVVVKACTRLLIKVHQYRAWLGTARMVAHQNLYVCVPKWYMLDTDIELPLVNFWNQLIKSIGGFKYIAHKESLQEGNVESVTEMKKIFNFHRPRNIWRLSRMGEMTEG